jgi:hypothetical protein
VPKAVAASKCKALPLLAPRVISLRCEGSDPIGGEADIPQSRRVYSSDVNDPQQTLGPLSKGLCSAIFLFRTGPRQSECAK